MNRLQTQQDIDNFKMLSAMDMVDCMSVDELSDLQDRIRVAIVIKAIRSVKDRTKGKPKKNMEVTV